MNVLRSLLLFFSFALPAAAQLQVTAKFERENFISGEPLRVTVSVTNSVGRDAVLGGPGGTSWLGFTLMTSTGEIVPPLSELKMDAIRIRNGETLQRRFDLRNYYYLDDPGSFMIRASAYYPDLDRHLGSKHVRFNIVKARQPFWERSTTLPAGHRNAGKYRRFQLFSFHDVERTWLYCRIMDEDSQTPMVTFPLSSMIPDHNAMPTLDAQHQMHVLYLGSPSVWVYMIIDLDGTVVEQKYYRNKGARPQLVTAAGGQVTVAGGIVYDPVEEQKKEKDIFRRVSERPPGLPQVK